MSAPQLTLYYDGKCPFCRAEMARLRGGDTASRLAFIDISLPGFDPAFVLSYLYRLFARHRYTMSRLLGYRSAPACTDGVCQRDL